MIPHSSFLLYLFLSPSLIRDPPSPQFSNHHMHPAICLLLLSLSFSTPMQRSLCFPGFCSYSRLYTLIWTFGVRNLRWKRAFNMIISSCIYLSTKLTILFFFAFEYQYITYIYHIFIIYLSVEGHLDCFNFIVIVNKATKKMCLSQNLWTKMVNPTGLWQGVV